MYILETSFESRQQNIYYIKHVPKVTDKEWNRHATRINCFFHRTAKDGIRYNVTNFRQFTRHDDEEEQFFKNVEELTGKSVIKVRLVVSDLDRFFEMVGFNYLTKSWRRQGEICKKWNGSKFI